MKYKIVRNKKTDIHYLKSTTENILWDINFEYDLEIEYMLFCCRNDILLTEDIHFKFIKGIWHSTTYDQPDSYNEWVREKWRIEFPDSSELKNIFRDVKLLALTSN